MALNLRRWILGAILGCGLTAAVYLPPSPPLQPSWTEGFDRRDLNPERARVQRLESHLRGTKRALATVLRRDSLAQALRSHRYLPNTPPTLRIDRHWTAPVWMRLAIEATLDSVWRHLDPKSAEVGFAIIIDAGRVENNAMYFLPAATGGHTCVAVVKPSWRLERFMGDSAPPADSLPLREWLQSGLGPCAFYAAFGRPGSHIEDWLLARQFDLATETDWNPVDPRDDATDMQRASYWRTSFDAMACIAGDRARCRVALFTPEPTPWGQTTHEDLRGVVSPPWFWTATLFEGGRFLSDLIRTMGAERFGSFWHSPADVDKAFVGAFGVPLETYTQGWGRRRMGRLSAGPAARLSTVLLSIGFAGAVLAGLSLYSVRRQVA